jgi:K(+)-stimulated pyrophosphate-energized sodium pump
LLAVEIAVQMTMNYRERLKIDPNAMNWSPWVGVFFFVIALFFVHRSFYGMRIPAEDTAGTNGNLVLPHKVHREEMMAGRK